MPATISLENLNRFTRVYSKRERSRIPLDELCPDCDGAGGKEFTEAPKEEPWLSGYLFLRKAYPNETSLYVQCLLCDGTGRDPEAEARKHIRSLTRKNVEICPNCHRKMVADQTGKTEKAAYIKYICRSCKTTWRTEAPNGK